MVKTVSTVFSGDRSPEGRASSSRSLYPCSTVKGVRRSWEKAAFNRLRSSTAAHRERLFSSREARMVSKDWHSLPSSSPVGTATWKSKSFWAIFWEAAFKIARGFLIFQR